MEILIVFLLPILKGAIELALPTRHLHKSLINWYIKIYSGQPVTKYRPRGAMVNVFAYGQLAAKDSRFESWRGRFLDSTGIALPHFFCSQSVLNGDPSTDKRDIYRVIIS